MERMLQISTALGEDAFFVESFSGKDEMSRLFEYQLVLFSEQSDIRAEDLLGTNATVYMETLAGQEPRYFNGYISRLSLQGQFQTPAFGGRTGFRYQATLSPWLWFLTRASTSQIFQQKTIEEVIEEVLGRWSALTSLEKRIMGRTELREYCVQYRETDFSFFSRLVELAGLYYFFTHGNGTHTLVLVDDLRCHQPTPGLEELRYSAGSLADASLKGWDMTAEVQPGAYSLNDFDYMKPRSALAKVASMEREHKNSGFELYDYPGEYVSPEWGEAYSKIRLEEHTCCYEVAQGTATERAIQVGSKLKLADHPVASQNREYLVVSQEFRAVNNLAESSGGSGASYHCAFKAIPSSNQFRSPRRTPKPLIGGLQTALVVGPSGEEIYTDDLGRVKLRFHWDRYGEGNERDSCWVRVSQPWAGKGWGAVNIPRIGQEVVVQFVEGDPDRPLVTGRVYNEENKPPYQSFGENKTRTGFMTRTYQGGNEEFNELRFDDKRGSEQVYLQAQRNLDVRVKKDRHLFVGGESHRIVEKDLFEKMGGDCNAVIAGDHTEKTEGTLSFNVGQDTHLKSGQKILQDAGMEIHLKAGMKVVIEAGAQLTLKVGGSFIDINPGGISITGTMVMVNSGGTPAAGSGAAPLAPSQPVEAMTSHGGEKEQAATARPRPKRFSPQAIAFKKAAQSGAAYCPAV